MELIDLAFYVMALFTVTGAVITATSNNIVRSAFAVLLTLAGVGGLYGVAQADFVAGAQLLIYVGGILVLALFAISLTQRIAEIQISNLSTGVPTAAILALVTLGTTWMLAGRLRALGARAGQPSESLVGEIGRLLFDKFLLPFEIVSVLLLAALVGAAYLARREVKGDEDEEGAP